MDELYVSDICGPLWPLAPNKGGLWVVLLRELLLVHKISIEAVMVEKNVCGNSESTMTQ